MRGLPNGNPFLTAQRDGSFVPLSITKSAFSRRVLKALEDKMVKARHPWGLEAASSRQYLSSFWTLTSGYPF